MRGDLSGSLWRFDINDASVQKLGSTSATAGNRPITASLNWRESRSASPPTPWCISALAGTWVRTTVTAPSASVAQGIFAVKDTGTDIGTFTDGSAALVSQTLNSSVTPRTTTNNAVDWSSNNGWYVTVPVGERFNVDPGLQLGTLVIAANKPSTDYCQPTGSSILYQLNYKSGFVLKTNEFQAQTVGQYAAAAGRQRQWRLRAWRQDRALNRCWPTVRPSIPTRRMVAERQVPQPASAGGRSSSRWAAV